MTKRREVAAAALYCTVGLSVAVYSLLNVKGVSWIGSLISVAFFVGIGYFLLRRP